MVPKDVRLTKYSGQGWGAFWGDWKRKEDEVTMCEIQMNQQWFEKARQIGTCPIPFWEQAPSLKKSENLPLIFILTFNLIFSCNFYAWFPVHFPPVLPKEPGTLRYLLKTNRPLCSIILVLGNNDQGVPRMGCGNSREDRFHLRSLERNKYPSC